MALIVISNVFASGGGGGGINSIGSSDGTISTTGSSPSANVKIAQQGATDGQVLTWDNTSGQFKPKTAPGSVSITSPKGTVAIGGTSTNPTLDLAQQSATNGQVLAWNSTDEKYEPITIATTTSHHPQQQQRQRRQQHG